MSAKVIEDTFKDHVAMAKLLDIIGGKWTPAVLYAISREVNRHGLLTRAIPKISKKMLTQSLRNLERDGLIRRKIYPEIPPRVEYFLTAMGTRFVELLMYMCRWADSNLKHLDTVLQTREESSEHAEELPL